MLDPFHLEHYGEAATNYNRDVEIFPVVRAMFEKIYGASPYKSPTDMGVNMVGDCIVDDAACRDASKKEILRRYYTALCEKRKGHSVDSAVNKLKLLMTQVQIAPEDRTIIAAAQAKKEETGQPAAALELPDGRIVVGKTSKLLGASSALILNAVKVLAGIHKDVDLISREVIEPVQELKILERVLEQGAPLTVALQMRQNEKRPAFERIRYCKDALCRIAFDRNIAVRDLAECVHPPLKKAKDLLYLEAALFGEEERPFKGAAEHLSLEVLFDPYEECKTIAARILKDVTENGGRFLDHGVAVRNMADTKAFSWAFSRPTAFPLP
jgi:hypothetical protein